MKPLIPVLLLLAACNLSYSQNAPEAYFQLEKYHDESNYESCLNLSKEIESLMKGRIDTVAANSYSYLGTAYTESLNAAKAVHFYEQEKNIREKIGNKDEYYSICLNNLAYAYLQSGAYAKAATTADQILDYDEKLYATSSEEFASSVFNIVEIYIATEKFKAAETLLKRTLKEHQENTTVHGVLLHKLGDVYLIKGEYSKSSAALNKAVNILFKTAGENSPEFTNAAITLGILNMSQGKYVEAEEIFNVALNIVSRDEPLYPTLLNNQALVLQKLGQIEKAIKMFSTIKEIDSVSIGTIHPDYAITLTNLGMALFDAGKYAQAERALNNALQIRKINKETRTTMYASNLNNLARVYQASGQQDKAIVLLEQSLELFKKNLGTNSPEYATASFNLGNANWRAGKRSVAIKHLRKSAEIRGKVLGTGHPKYAESILKIAEFEWEQKNIDEANRLFNTALTAYENHMNNTFAGLTEEEKSKFYYTTIKDAFDKYYSFAVSNNTNASLLQAAYDYHSNNKGIIMHATDKVKKSILSSNDQVLIGLFEDWQNQKEQIARLYGKSGNPATIDSLVRVADLREKELSRRSAEFDKQFGRKKISWRDIQSKLAPGEAAIEIIRYKDYSPGSGGKFTGNAHYLFLVLTSESTNHPDAIVISKGKDLEGKFLRYYHNNLKYSLDDTLSYKNYFEPVATFLQKRNINKLFISTDGVYNQLNLNTIYNPTSRRYILDEFDITFLTNTREVAENVGSEKHNTSTNTVLIGFPKFNLAKNQSDTSAQIKLTRGGNLTRELRGLLRFMRGNEGITELPGTQKEIENITQLLPEKPSVYLEHNASEETAKKVNDPKFLHIATHGYFLQDEDLESEKANQYFPNPLLKSGLILAGAENFLLTGQPVNEYGDDGILTAYEAMNLNLDHTQLVVLSACQTGLGDIRNGEGVYGLQRAFKLAGARSLVMSLWNVDDEATQELMTNFYDELIKSNNQKEAFRKAQMRTKAKYDKPFYWGAFVMVGN